MHGIGFNLFQIIIWKRISDLIFDNDLIGFDSITTAG